MNKQIIQSKNLPYNDNMITIPTSKNCIFPSVKNVYNLMVKDYLFATLATTQYNQEYFNFIYNNLNFMYKYDEFLSEEEKSIVNKLLSNDSSVNRNNLSWLYEECFILAWMLNLCNFPSQERENEVNILNDFLFLQFDEQAQKNIPSKLYKLVFNKETKSINYNLLSIKSFSEILDKADLIKRYLWALEELKIKNIENKSGINGNVVHYQLEAFRKILNWDLTSPGI